MEPVPLPEGRVVHRVLAVARPVEVLLLEGVGVQDEEPAVLEIAQVDLEGGGVHGDQAVEPIPRGVHATAAELELEARDPEEGAGRSTNLRGEAGQRRPAIPSL